jgi:hypothetical protein
VALFFFARRVLGRLFRASRATLRFSRGPIVVPLTFEEVERRRRQAQGSGADRTACCCSECRHVRMAARTDPVGISSEWITRESPVG